MKNIIKNKLPSKEGLYWLKYKQQFDEEYRVDLLKTTKTQNSFMHVVNGGFLFTRDLRGDYWIQKVILPTWEE